MFSLTINAVRCSDAGVGDEIELEVSHGDDLRELFFDARGLDDQDEDLVYYVADLDGYEHVPFDAGEIEAIVEAASEFDRCGWDALAGLQAYADGYGSHSLGCINLSRESVEFYEGTPEDFARDYIESFGYDIPDIAAQNIDYEGVVRDMEHDGYVFEELFGGTWVLHA